MAIEPDGPGLIAYPIRPVLRLDLWRLFIKDFPARLCHTGIYRYAPTLISCAKVPQLPRESDDWGGMRPRMVGGTQDLVAAAMDEAID